ncbi:MAG: hydrogenase expression/formation protein HypE, partial [candidate division Zixibacteria bacterium]|nr:hydrogenase expression/formation protein HypE [candidate division Zixibacteria bacterium]
LAFTTDSYVVHPLFFPGGDIGTMAVNGTVNDLAMAGARPLYLSTGLIIEEGLSTETFWKVIQSMKQAAAEIPIQLVTGDTKVVERGKGDGLFINTAGIGIIEHDYDIMPTGIRAGDSILLSGDIGRHGMAIMAAWEGLAFESDIKSDCAPLSGLVLKLLAAGIKVHCLRDLTRGGLASALVEIAEASGKYIEINENSIPVPENVRGACEILGLDPLYVANEGRMVVFVESSTAASALDVMHSDPLGQGAFLIGHVDDNPSKMVTLRNKIGTSRIIDMFSGEQLPRIC